ncbi:nitrogenase stabilizing/protective protein NifW [Rhodomicrobium vannielii ATCC 17100]|uniref:nitrogenase stabilizing/protective protein NifW n=1 Tax=Rhodomicrobium vannielii TaxID=1069 RepID=UPI00191A05F8|nr:nitrogenase stabilizing/protective protein NifW [Rhodomicrobium vannielii]MBJ7534748.1 nitrogenase stabilizing/protective protein NifW [Rhodomicrobium vannielii ATCC 17100]
MSVLSDLEKLPSAEDFFAYLKVDYDPDRLKVARLHILKRMGQYLAQRDFAGATDEEVYAAARETLAHAYDDFVKSTPLQERVFKVLQEHHPDRPKEEAPKAFVPLDSLTIIGR